MRMVYYHKIIVAKFNVLNIFLLFFYENGERCGRQKLVIRGLRGVSECLLDPLVLRAFLGMFCPEVQ